MSLKRKIFWWIYIHFSSKMSDNKKLKAVKAFRCFIIRRFIESMGTNVNINKHAEITPLLKV